VDLLQNYFALLILRIPGHGCSVAELLCFAHSAYSRTRRFCCRTTLLYSFCLFQDTAVLLQNYFAVLILRIPGHGRFHNNNYFAFFQLHHDNSLQNYFFFFLMLGLFHTITVSLQKIFINTFSPAGWTTYSSYTHDLLFSLLLFCFKKCCRACA
jgi:hypothetical protein